jgi:hypothetical protein
MPYIFEISSFNEVYNSTDSYSTENIEAAVEIFYGIKNNLPFPQQEFKPSQTNLAYAICGDFHVTLKLTLKH